MRRLARALVLALAAAVVPSCGNGSSNGSPIDAGSGDGPTEPCPPPGAFAGPWTLEHASGFPWPSVVLCVAEGFLGYGPGPGGEGVLRMTSADGLAWTAVPPKPVIPYDGLRRILPGAVLVEGGEWRMWFQSDIGLGPLGGDPPSTLGWAASSDGVTWTLHPTPVLEGRGAGHWSEWGVARPSVIRDGAVYKMLFTGFRSGGLPLPSIGCAESADGLTWTALDDPVLQGGGALQTRHAWLIKEGGFYHAWFDTRPSQVARIGYAVSQDARHWTLFDDGTGSPIVLGDPSAPDLTTPCVLRTSDGLRMWLEGGFVATLPLD